MPPAKRNHETDDESGCIERSATKAKKYSCKWKPDYSKDFPHFTASKKSPNHAYCTLCKQDFSIVHGGRNDLQKHAKTLIHSQAAKSNDASIKSFFTTKTTPPTDLEESTIRAEAKMCQMIAVNNLSLSNASVFTKLFQDMFPDSKIAKNMKCGRTKATAVVKEMSALTMASIAGKMKRNPWSIATDGSNEKNKKQFPIVVTVEGEDGLVKPVLLALPTCEEKSTGENIFKVVDNELRAQGIPWENCLAFGCDNAPVMTGIHKGVIAFVREKQPSIHLAGCCLHLVHIAAKKGAGSLAQIEDTLVDVFYYFQKSVNRQIELKHLQDLYDVEQQRMLKHVCTRWLSIKRCLERLLQHWEPLLHFFRQETKSATSSKAKDSKTGQSTQTKAEGIYEFLRSPTNKLHAHFLLYTLNAYDKVLVYFQKEEPMVHKLHGHLCQLMRDLFDRFLLPSESGKKDMKEVQFHLREQQKADEDLLIGSAAMSMIANKEDYHLRDKKIKEFYSCVRQYFIAVCTYLLQNLPLEDRVLQNAAVADPANRKDVTTSQLSFFLSKYKILADDVDAVLEEFARFQRAELDLNFDRVDEFWTQNEKDYPALSRAMKGILTIPHSSAPCERVFSMVRKTCTEQRSCLSQDTTEALLVLKMRPSTELSSEELKKVKSAYCQSLKK